MSCSMLDLVAPAWWFFSFQMWLAALKNNTHMLQLPGDATLLTSLRFSNASLCFGCWQDLCKTRSYMREGGQGEHSILARHTDQQTSHTALALAFAARSSCWHHRSPPPPNLQSISLFVWAWLMTQEVVQVRKKRPHYSRLEGGDENSNISGWRWEL